MVQRRRLPWPWLSVVIILLAIIAIPIVRGFVGRLSLTVIQPVARLGQTITDRWSGIDSAGQAATEQSLRTQVEELTSKLYEVNLQLETVQAAVKLSDFSAAAKHTLIVASVIAVSPDPGIQSLIINRGSNDHIQLGQVVVADRGAVVGKIVSVHQNQSTVLLITDRQSVVASRIQNQQQSPGVIRGERGLALQMGFIPKNDTVKNGDTIVTSGTEPLIPPDILIGSIASTNSRAGDLFQQALVTPSAPLERLRVVAVIKQ